MNKIFLIIKVLFFTQSSYAQEPKKSQTIDINSSYKPVLRNAVKINFNGSLLAADTATPKLQYNIPAQNLTYAYMPISLKPLALEPDTTLYLGNRNFVKLGYGNYSTPFVSVGYSVGDGKQYLVNFTGNYIKSRGNIANQDYSQLQAKVQSSFFMPTNEIYGGLQINANNYYLYGYDHKALSFNKNDIRQQFQNVQLNAGFKNTSENAVGINYDPNINISIFSNKNKAAETNVKIALPAEKIINENFSARVELKADITNYKNKTGVANAAKINNNIVQILPSVNYSTDILKLHVGISPVFDNKAYSLLPDFYAEAQVKDNVFAVQAGWVGRIIKNNYENLTAINPYLSPLLTQINTKETEYYGGIKASIAKHFNFSAKAGLVRYKNLPLFINDTTTTDGKSFVISNETSINNFRLHGDISYINKEKFELTAGITFNGYTSLKTNAKAWHTMPVEIKGSLRWWLLKSLLVKGDAYIFEGNSYLEKGNTSKSLKGGTDISAGIEYKINDAFSVWGNANNILNSKYERWHNYQVYGANFIGGILLHF